MPQRASTAFRVAGARIVLVVLAMVALVALVPAAPANAGPGTPGTCPSPYEGKYDFKSFGPTGTSSTVNTAHTATALVADGNGRGLPGVCVQFTKNSGPSSGWPRYINTDTKGLASIDWTSATTGTDSIRATVPDFSGQPFFRDILHTWTAKPTPTRTASPTPSPTRNPTASPTPRPTRSPTPSPTPSATATPTATPSATATPVPTASDFGDGSIELDRPSTIPGGSATLTGRNCPAGEPVTFTVEGSDAGTATAQPDGTFSGDVQLPDASIGRHLIDVTCAGSAATVAIDLVVSSSTSSPAAGATAVAVLVFFVLLGSVLFARNNPKRRATSTDEPDATS